MRKNMKSVIGFVSLLFASITLVACATVEQSPEDRQLERVVEKAIAAGPSFSSAAVSVTVLGGVAILKGSLQQGVDRIIIEKIVRDIEGITEIRNYIFVE